MAPAETTPARSGEHRTALDGLRAFAILGVMFVHAGVPGFRSGWIGVDVFFVLSGFLITTLLALESSASGRIAYGQFMARRALRLMPAYFLYAALITVLIWCWPGSVRSENDGWNAVKFTAALWTYTINFVPQGGVWNGQDLTVHLWSLAVEQQYYLVWPLVVVALHTRAAWLRWVALAIAVGATESFILAPQGLYREHMLFTRGFSLVVGSALAIWAMRRPDALAHKGVNRLVDSVGVTLLVALFVMPYRAGWSAGRTLDVFVPLLVPIFALWVARLWHLPSSGWTRTLMQNRGLVYIGKISYGVYLYHEAVRVAVWDLMKPVMSGWAPAPGFVVRLLIYVAISLVLAAISYEQFEKRFLRLAARFRPSRAGTPAAA